MKHAALLSLLLAVAGCGFAQKHPAVTIGITAGIVGFGACGMAVEKLDTCSLVGAAAGLGLGGIAGLALLLGGEEDHALPPFQEEDGVIREGTPPPPGLPVDAGVPETAPVGSPLASPAVRPDAGVAPSSALDAGAAPVSPGALDAGVR